MRADVFTLFPEWFEWFVGQRHVRNAIAAGAELRFVQDWLGHSNIQNTVVYSYLTVRGRDSAARKVFLHLPRF